MITTAWIYQQLLKRPPKKDRQGSWIFGIYNIYNRKMLRVLTLDKIETQK